MKSKSILNKCIFINLIWSSIFFSPNRTHRIRIIRARACGGSTRYFNSIEIICVPRTLHEIEIVWIWDYLRRILISRIYWHLITWESNCYIPISGLISHPSALPIAIVWVFVCALCNAGWLVLIEFLCHYRIIYGYAWAFHHYLHWFICVLIFAISIHRHRCGRRICRCRIIM